jgi:PAS domain-containing protein
MERELDGIWIFDAEARTAYASERMAEILGTSPSEMVGRASFDYLFPDDIEEAQRLFGREDARRHEAASCSSSHHHLLFCQVGSPSGASFRGQRSMLDSFSFATHWKRSNRMTHSERIRNDTART